MNYETRLQNESGVYAERKGNGLDRLSTPKFALSLIGGRIVQGKGEKEETSACQTKSCKPRVYAIRGKRGFGVEGKVANE